MPSTRTVRTAVGGLVAVGAVAAHDLVQKRHAILRNFPVIGHAPLPARDARTGAAPVHRHLQRRGAARSAATSAAGCTPRPSWRTTTSASAPTTTSSTPTATWSSSTARSPTSRPPCDAAPGRRRARCPAPRCWAGRAVGAHAFRPASVVNISGMSFGSLSGPAIEAMNRGAAAGRMPAQHGRGRPVAAPPARRRPRLPDRHGLLRLPRRRRPLRPRALAEGSGRRAPGAGRGDQAVARAPSPAWAACCPASKVTPEIAATRGDRGGGGLRQPVPPHRVRRHRRDARLRREPSPSAPACRSASSRRSATSASGSSLARADGATASVASTS